MNSQSQIVEKVRKLLALSKSSNINEAANAAAIANKYIVQYRLKEADMIEQVTQDQTRTQEYHPEPILDDPEPMYESARVTPWKLQLALILAHHYGCAIWNDKQYGVSRGGRNVSRFRLIGRSNDVKFAKYMFSWLVNEIQRHSDFECKGRGHTSSASYCQGAVTGVENLLRSSRDQQVVAAAETGKSKAITRMNNREREAQEYMYRKHHLVDAAPQKPKFDSNAFNRGFDVGNYIGTHLTPSTEE